MAYLTVEIYWVQALSLYGVLSTRDYRLFQSEIEMGYYIHGSSSLLIAPRLYTERGIIALLIASHFRYLQSSHMVVFIVHHSPNPVNSTIHRIETNPHVELEDDCILQQGVDDPPV